MNADDVRLKLPLYAAGELNHEETAAIKQALEASPELRAELASWESLRACTNRILADAAMPAGLDDRVAAALRSARRSGASRTIRFGRAVLGIAAAVALAWLIYPVFKKPPTPPTPVPAVLASLPVAPEQFSEIYAHCASGDKPHCAMEFRNQKPEDIRAELVAAKGHEVLIPNLESAGYAFDGVCMCFRSRGENIQVVHAFYRNLANADDRVSLFSTDHLVKLSRCSHACPQYQYATVDDVNIVKWDGKAESFAMCGRMAESKLVQLADEARIALAARPSAPAYATAPSPPGP